MFDEKYLELLKMYGPLAALAGFAGIFAAAFIRQQWTLIKASLEHQKTLAETQNEITKTLENHLSHIAQSEKENVVQQEKVAMILSGLLEEQRDFRKSFSVHCIDFALHQERTEKEKKTV